MERWCLVALLRKVWAGRRSVVTLAIAAAMVMSVAGAALGASTIGNEALDRSEVDNSSNFTVVDTNNPATFDGYFEEVTFWAHRLGTINFVVLSGDEITYVSSDLEVTAPGLQTASLGDTAGVVVGDNLGYYLQTQGVIDYDNALENAGERVRISANNDGFPPEPGDNLGFFEWDFRIYSMNATINPASPDVCKKGGWETYGDFKNQGQCIASFVANDNAEPHNKTNVQTGQIATRDPRAYAGVPSFVLSRP